MRSSDLFLKTKFKQPFLTGVFKSKSYECFQLNITNNFIKPVSMEQALYANMPSKN